MKRLEAVLGVCPLCHTRYELDPPIVLEGKGLGSRYCPNGCGRPVLVVLEPV